MLLLLVLSLVLFSTQYNCVAQPAQTETDSTVRILQQADQAAEEGDLSSAVEKYREALTILEKQNDLQSIAKILYKLGVVLIEIGNYQDADPTLKKALNLHEKINDTSGAAFDLTSMAQLNFMKGNPQEALALTEKALVLHEETKNKEGIAETLLVTGIVNFKSGDLKKASDLFNRSLSISKEIGNTAGAQQSLNMLAVIEWQEGNFDKALEFFQEAIPLAEQLSDPSGLATLFSNMGLVYADKGESRQALEYLNKSLQIERKRGGRQDIANCLYNISTVYGDQGNYEKARLTAQEALSVAEEIGDKSLAASCLDLLGNLYSILANYDTALQYLQRSVQLAKMIDDKSGLAYTLKKIGSLYAKQSKFTQSVQHYNKALLLFEELGGKRGVALTLNSLGDVHSKLGNYDQAQREFEKALSIAQASRIKPIECESYIGLGSTYYKKSEMTEAEAAFSKSIEISKEISYPHILWRALHKKSLVYRDTGKITEALDLLKESVDVIETVRSELQLAEEKAGYFEEKLVVYEDLVAQYVAAQKSSDAFEFAQKAKARSFLDTLAEAKIDPLGNVDPKLKQKKKDLLREIVNVQKNIETEYENEQFDKKKLDLLSKKRNELDVEYTNLTLEIRKQNPQYAELKYPHPLTLPAAQEMLDDQTILLEYFIGETNSFLFAITNNDAHTYSLPGEQTLTKQVLTIRESLQNPKDNRYKRLATVLYTELLKSAEAQLNGKTHIVIAPDGSLNYLPFECLINPDVEQSHDLASSFMALQFDIYYVPSMSVLKAIRQKPEFSSQKQFIAFANPMFKQAAMKENPVLVRGWGTLGPLPNAKKEVQEIATFYTPANVTIMLGENASEKNVKTMKLNEYRKVHFASHGLINEDKPEFSALLLTSDQQGEEDGLLTMREVFDLKFNADLVVLSACKTGLGENIRGEGVAGLARSFLVAGASTVLVSLWDVYDRTTADFMKAFYENMEQKHMSKAEALKRVRDEMIHSKTSNHPYYWAPFVLIGNN